MTGNNPQHGFTLVEVLIATGVIGIVVVLATNLFLLHITTQSQTQEGLELEGALRQMESVIRQEIMEGTDIAFGGSPDELTLRDRQGRAVRLVIAGSGSDRHLFLCRGASDVCTGDPHGNAAFSALHPQETSIVSASFFLHNANTAHPLVTLIVQIADDQSQQTSSLLQFSVTSRAYVP